jgi:hypothetical protein
VTGRDNFIFLVKYATFANGILCQYS